MNGDDNTQFKGQEESKIEGFTVLKDLEIDEKSIVFSVTCVDGFQKAPLSVRSNSDPPPFFRMKCGSASDDFLQLKKGTSAKSGVDRRLERSKSPMSVLTNSYEKLLSIEPTGDGSVEEMDVDSSSDCQNLFFASDPGSSCEPTLLGKKRTISQSHSCIQFERRKQGKLKQRVAKTNSFGNAKKILFREESSSSVDKSEFFGKLSYTTTIPVRDVATVTRSSSFSMPLRTDREIILSPPRKRVKRENSDECSFDWDKGLELKSRKKKNRKLAKSARFPKKYRYSEHWFEEQRSEVIPYFRKDERCRIDCETLVDLCCGIYEEKERVLVIDCRYDYEYDGGHVKNALHLPLRDRLADLFKDPPSENDPKVIVFYCEFSSERAPRAYDHIRSLDRNSHTYPELRYPDIYLLDGGYAKFYEYDNQFENESFCTPRSYIKMLDRRFLDRCQENCSLSQNNF
eukprot:TRINITY_DN3528_c0_g1_i1.p1 TRINITY_DN3528_c0_g1~~TRINITY_DN3528_c0_g1_i1.p1  ORF type:complete len:457 (+),score=82.89 TRINITY_DN3528_c0_g1_i1:52-1422(+)